MLPATCRATCSRSYRLLLLLASAGMPGKLRGSLLMPEIDQRRCKGTASTPAPDPQIKHNLTFDTFYSCSRFVVCGGRAKYQGAHRRCGAARPPLPRPPPLTVHTYTPGPSNISTEPLAPTPVQPLGLVALSPPSHTPGKGGFGRASLAHRTLLPGVPSHIASTPVGSCVRLLSL